MPTSKLKLEAVDLLKLVNMTGEANLFPVGDDPGMMAADDVVQMMELEEQAIISMLPEHYRNILSGRVSGEYLTDKDLGAATGTTELQLSFAPIVEDSLLLFHNFHDLAKPWRDRTRSDAMSTADYTVDEETGIITLAESLQSGDSVLAVYQHDAGAMFTSVRQLVLKAARLEWHLRLPNWNEASTVITEGREAIDDAVLAYSNGNGNPKGIQEIDDVQFIDSEETRKSPNVTMRIPFMGGRP